MYQLAIFDLDGTLLDTLADLRQGLNYALSTQGFAPRTLPEVRAFVGNGIPEADRARRPRRHGRGADRSGLRGVQSLLRRPLRGFYNALSRHFGAAAAAAGGRRRVRRRVQQAGLCRENALRAIFPGTLAASAGAKDGVRKKPCPDAVFEVVRQLGAEALRAVYIGDSEVDVATARNAGMPCISVSWGFRDRDVLVNAGAETICDSMDALYRALREG